MNGPTTEAIPGATPAKGHVRARRRGRIGVLLVLALVVAVLIATVAFFTDSLKRPAASIPPPNEAVPESA